MSRGKVTDKDTAIIPQHVWACALSDVLKGRDGAPQACTLYAVFDSDQPLYVGRSIDPDARLRQHVARSSWLGLQILMNAPESGEWLVRFYKPISCRDLIARNSPGNLPSFDRALALDWEWATKIAEPFLVRYLRPKFNGHYNGSRGEE